jgi:hypothetical protein
MSDIEYTRTIDGDFQRVVAVQDHDDGSRFTRWALVGPDGAISLHVRTNRPNGWEDLAEGMYIHAFTNRWAGTSMDDWPRESDCDLLPGGSCWSEYGSAIQAGEVWHDYVRSGGNEDIIFAAFRERYADWTKDEAAAEQVTS